MTAMKTRFHYHAKNLVLRALPALLAGGALVLSSCVTPYPGPAETHGGVTGAVVGGLAGAIIGNQSGRPLEGAAIGGALGALAGSAIGAGEDARYGYHPGYGPYYGPRRVHAAPVRARVGYNRWGGRGFYSGGVGFGGPVFGGPMYAPGWGYPCW